MASFQPTPAIFDIDPDLKVKEELVGIHSTGPFTPQDSSARSYMASSHISQSLALNHGEDKIIQTGLEKQLGENTFSIKFPEDSRIVKVIPRYRGLSSNSINKVVEYTIILEDLEHNRLDILNVPFFHSTHPYFGFKYDWKKDVIDTLSVGDIVNKGTILADSPTKSNGKNWGNGVNANIALISLPETTEDGAVISESLAKKLSYTVFETRVIEFGNNNFPLNIYGDENNYKPFPDIGEFVNEDSVIMVLRDYEERLSPALAGRYDVNEFNPLFDRAVYVRGPGEITKDGNIKGQVVDIKVYTNPKAKHDVYTGTTEGIDKYVNSLKMYYQDILDVYRQKLDEYYSIHKNYNLPLSSELHNVIKEAYAVVNPDNRKLGYTFRSDPMDLYRVEIKIMYTVVPGIGHKLSDEHGWPQDISCAQLLNK